MDPLNIARAADNSAKLAYAVGDTIFELWQGFSEAGREYERFSREVSQLGTCWVTLRQSLQQTLCPPTEHILRPLHRIIYDTNAILNDLKINLNQFRTGTERYERLAGGGFLRYLSSLESERRRRLQKFIRKRKIPLQRSQIVYAKAVIDVVIAVFQYECLSSAFVGFLTLFVGMLNPKALDVRQCAKSVLKILSFARPTTPKGAQEILRERPRVGLSRCLVGSILCLQDRRDTEVPLIFLPTTGQNPRHKFPQVVGPVAIKQRQSELSNKGQPRSSNRF